jgi:hypothetical protein
MDNRPTVIHKFRPRPIETLNCDTPDKLCVQEKLETFKNLKAPFYSWNTTAYTRKMYATLLNKINGKKLHTEISEITM